MTRSRKEHNPPVSTLDNDCNSHDFTFDCKTTLEYLSYFSDKWKCNKNENHKFNDACQELNSLNEVLLTHCERFGK